MIVFKESPLVLTDGAIETQSGQTLREIYSLYAAIAKRFNLPMQLGTQDPRAVPLVRDVALSSGARIVIAGVMVPSSNDYREQAAALASAGVDFLYAQMFPSVDELQEAARAMSATQLPFVVAPMPPLATAIARLDDDAAARPWHYMLVCLSPADAATALESLFRSAPALAHRVVGLQANGSPDYPEQFAREIWECAQTFGLHVLGGCHGTNARHIEAIAEISRRNEASGTV
ncbi:MAG: homocysteine S-methyltransferase family protein [Candidatus Eremiobacteraeota bacterium]|nr:homocysteine S-methyltransferase family protein [Candidatus Eremiobacteraeota bacterium]